MKSVAIILVLLGVGAVAATILILLNDHKQSDGLKVLVFGDSQGDVGPTYKVIQDQLNQHNISNFTVANAAVGGTLSCGWNENPDAIVKASKQHFGKGVSPDLVWFTAGGNDIANDDTYHDCLDSAEDDSSALECLDSATERLLPCTISLLEHLWSTYPNAKVGMYNYEIPCTVGDCLEADLQFIGGSYCAKQKDVVGCMVAGLVHWQQIYVDHLQQLYPAPKFTGMNVLGAAQEASGPSHIYIYIYYIML